MLALTSSSTKSGQSYNFGPPVDSIHTVEQLVQGLAQYLGSSGYTIGKSLPAPECGLLKLNYDKALHELDWKPLLDFNTTIRYTAEWYKQYSQSSPDMLEFTQSQIQDYLLKTCPTGPILNK